MRRQLPAFSPLTASAVGAALHRSLSVPERLRDEIAATLCHRYAARDALLVGSGTQALQLAIAGVQATRHRGPVAMPAYCCYDLASAADGANADVLLYDLAPETLGPEARSLQLVMARGPTAVVAAHLYGYPVDMRGLAAASAESGAILIEDAAQAAGGMLDGVALGSFGSVSVMSFGRGKGVSAGAGGALLAHDEAGAQIVSWAARQILPPRAGIGELLALIAQWAFGRPALYGLPAAFPFLRLGETLYHEPDPVTAMSGAAIGALRVGLRAQPSVRRRLTATSRLLQRARASERVLTIGTVTGAEPGYLRLPLRVHGVPAASVVRALGRHGVAPAYPSPLATLHPFQSRVLNRTDEFDGARELADSLITFPTHERLEESDIVALESWLAGTP